LAEGASNIQFVGWVDDEGLRCLIGRAVATIYLPRDEDFGMSPVESMAAGKPVIGVAEGGVLETVVDGKTGILLPPDPSPEAVCQAVKRLGPVRARTMREACEIRARRFDRQVFLDRMRRLVGDVSKNL
ncbi:MAG: glycosyltransferase, partial [Methylothermaceae bacterium]|nr:glycosyltransferase [Methylothermaceae bacterium]